MQTSRESLLDLIEQTYEVRHPDFEMIREQYKQIIGRASNQHIRQDAKILLAGVEATQHTYEDWEKLSDYEKENALKAVRKMNALTRSIFNKHGVDIPER